MTDHFSNRKKLVFAWIANVIFPLAGVSTDIYLPSLPAMSVQFDSSKSMLQITVTSFLIAMAIGQFFAGPISDAYGRKKPLIASMILQFIATVFIVFASSVPWIIFWRFFQGIGAALMMVPARAIINDIFTGDALKRQFNYTTISFALAPIVAPYIGGYLQHFFGWHASFIFIIIYQLITLLLLLVGFEETLKMRQKLSLKYFTGSYSQIFTNKHYIVCVAFLSVLMGYFSLFSIMGPFLVQDTLGKSAIFYGEVALLMGLAWFLGNVCNRILFRYDEGSKTNFSLVFNFIVSMLFVFYIYFNGFSVENFMIPTFLMIFASGFIFPIYISEALMIFSPELAASANGCLFSMTWLGFGVYTIVGAMIKATSPLPFAIVLGVVSIICLFLYYGLIIRTKKNQVLSS